MISISNFKGIGGRHMKIQRKIWNYILILVLGMMGMITIIFFLVEKLLLGDGRCYIPQRVIMIALMIMRVLAGSIDNSGMSVRKAGLKRFFMV